MAENLLEKRLQMLMLSALYLLPLLSVIQISSYIMLR